MLVLEASAERRVGSSPTFRTRFKICPNGEIGSTQEIQNLPLKSVSVRVRLRVPDYTCVYPRMVELVDTGDLKSPAERRAGSSPAPGTRFNSISKVRILFSCLHGVVKW